MTLGYATESDQAAVRAAASGLAVGVVASSRATSSPAAFFALASLLETMLRNGIADDWHLFRAACDEATVAARAWSERRLDAG